MRLAHLSLVACSLVLAASLCSAQSGAQAAVSALDHTTAALVQPPQTNCPVGFTVRHAPQGVVSQIGSAPPPGTQEFRVSLRPTAHSTITSAHILLYGLTGPQVLPANSAKASPSRQSEERTLTPQRIGDLFQSTVYTRRLTGLQWVELRSVRYADGTEWTAPTPGSCRVAPDGFLLVGSLR